ncbi:MAG TPA: hypothetical protein EYG03_19740 [Planctomycetes bacterium]|nr:hypothetical protein [Fuerstiella sp.]HIK94183.1 hypothetical protein [Planctomycetota bacterium]
MNVSVLAKTGMWIPRKGVLMSAIIVLMAAAALCQGAWAEDAQASDGVEAEKPLVGAYYYPWYRASRRDSDIGWMDRALRGRLEPRQLPKLGVYDSRNAEIIGSHIAQSLRGGIDFWVVSWWGPGHSRSGDFKNDILSHAEAGKLKYALFYESTGRFGPFDKPSFKTLVDDFKHMAENYFDNPHYLKIDGKPVVYIYLTHAYFRDGGHAELRRLREELPDVYLVGDDVFGKDGPGGQYRPKYARLWDAVTAYDVYGQSSKSLGGTRAALDKLNATYASARKTANAVGTGFIPAVSAGYNDRAVREGHPGRARYFSDVPGSKEGDIFRAMIRDVGLPNLDPRTGNIMMVNSFNEWYEDTQIEATAGIAVPTAKDDSKSGTFYTEGDTYTDYEYLYLDILREETKGK